jgi:hypothetical protein
MSVTIGPAELAAFQDVSEELLTASPNKMSLKQTSNINNIKIKYK